MSMTRLDYQQMGNGSPFQHSATVDQASGMVSVQAGCTPAQALDLMRDRATVEGQSLNEIAAAVLDRTMRFNTQP